MRSDKRRILCRRKTQIQLGVLILAFLAQITIGLCFIPVSRQHLSRSRTFKSDPFRRKTLRVIPTFYFATIENEADGGTEDRSKILSIRSSSLAGVSGEKQEEIDIAIGDPNLVAITGETGSGKSLLVARVASLLCGGKAVTSLIEKKQSAEAEMIFLLKEPQISLVASIFSANNIDADAILSPSENETVRLALTRSISLHPTTKRIKNVCSINGKTVTLKVLASITAQLVTVVDAGVAAQALVRPTARMAILDTAIPPAVQKYARESQKQYYKLRRDRERLEAEMASRTLPSSFSADAAQDTELMQHWIDELDTFEYKIDQFRENMAISGVSSDLNGVSALDQARAALMESSWMENDSGDPKTFSSGLFNKVTKLRYAIRNLDEQIVSVGASIDKLSSMSITESASVALDQARQHLIDATQSEDADSQVSEMSETAHDLLNSLEESLKECSRYMENEMMLKLEDSRESCPCSTEALDDLLGEWNTLARKHGIAPATLPSCHQALISERDGSVQAQELLPAARRAEAVALEQFVEACSLLSQERGRSAMRLMTEVTERLPDLGMDDVELVVDLDTEARECTSSAAYASSQGLGRDEVNFYLVARTPRPTADSEASSGSSTSIENNSPLHETASSGEKARILLAMECVLPGSVGACCGSAESSNSNSASVPPVAVVYDEIDAHVGGHAAVAVARMLVEQSTATTSNNNRRRPGGRAGSSQVICITHSPSLAASADRHVTIAKQKLSSALSSSTYNNSSDGINTPKSSSTTPDLVIRVTDVTDNPEQRQAELARMASGDWAAPEAQAFARALLREGSRSR